MRKSRGIISVGLAAALGAAAVAPASIAPTTAQSAVQAPETHPAPAAPSTVRVQNVSSHAALLSFTRFYRGERGVWVGTAKRGNRRHRARHNYRR